MVTASGNYPPFKFSHNGGTPQSTGLFSDIPPGTHSMSVIDRNECIVTQENIVVNTPASSTLALEISSITGDDACLSHSGSVTLNGTGSNGTLLYSFNNSAFTSKATYSSLASGTYDAQVKDVDGCISSKSVTIERKNTNTSWVNDVRPILANKCVTCHPGGGTSDDWGKYSSVFSKRDKIKTRASAGTMPPAGNTQLTASEKALIVCWIDDGAPEN
jgi:hypothetical protein